MKNITDKESKEILSLLIDKKPHLINRILRKIREEKKVKDTKK